MSKITEEELEKLNMFYKEHNSTKMSIADLEISKYSAIMKLEAIQNAYQQFDIELANKYGNGAMINKITGEITFKENG